LNSQTRAKPIWAPLLLALALAAPGEGRAEPADDDAIATLCGIVETSAKAEGLPVKFLTRLIWRESAFQPDVVSPSGAKGVAQFMPATASARGLANPFDPATAIPASAKFLAELVGQFGNLGLAAAAYNAGPTALASWLAGSGRLPIQTQDYVMAITGHDIEDWRGDMPKAAAAADPDEPCLDTLDKLRIAVSPAAPEVSGLFAPWGVQIAGSFSKDAALASFSRVEQRYSAVLGTMEPFVLGSRLMSRGFRPFYRVRLPAQTRQEAAQLCKRLRSAGGACVVLRS
jgi:Transglycosylase SLT domain/SPOR domain